MSDNINFHRAEDPVKGSYSIVTYLIVEEEEEICYKRVYEESIDIKSALDLESKIKQIAIYNKRQEKLKDQGVIPAAKQKRLLNN